MSKCLICKSEYQPFVDFGDMPIANAFSTKEELEDEYTFPMKVGLMNARATAYVFILLAIVVLYLPHWLGPLTMNQLLFQAPAIFLLMSLNGPLFKGEDYIAQQRVRMGMLLGLLALVVEVSV